MRISRDTRRTFFGNIFDMAGGDLNVVKLKRHVPIAWHRHQLQTDNLFCAAGRVRVGMDGEFFTLSEGHALAIPPQRYHGYEGLTKDAILVQFNTPKYNPADEERHPIDAEMPWTSQ